MSKMFSRDSAVLAPGYDLVCFSTLRWDAVVQRTQRLMIRFAERTRAFFIEAPVFEPSLDHLAITTVDGVTVVTPHLHLGTDPRRAESTLRRLLQSLFAAERIERYVLWYCTPETLPLTWLLTPLASVYDRAAGLDALSPDGSAYETSLLSNVDLVLTNDDDLDLAFEETLNRVDAIVRASTRRQHARLAARTLRSDVRYPNPVGGKSVTGCGVAALSLLR